MGNRGDILKILIGVSITAALNIIQGMTGVSRLPFNLFLMMLTLLIIFSIVMASILKEEEPAREKKQN